MHLKMHVNFRVLMLNQQQQNDRHIQLNNPCMHI
jgi:hypothetical protein